VSISPRLPLRATVVRPEGSDPTSDEVVLALKSCQAM